MVTELDNAYLKVRGYFLGSSVFELHRARATIYTEGKEMHYGSQ